MLIRANRKSYAENLVVSEVFISRVMLQEKKIVWFP